MSMNRFGFVALSATLALALAGTADAAPRKKNQQVRSSQHVRVNGYPTPFRVSPADSPANIRRTFGNLDPNPPSLRQEYDLRSRLTQENRR